jgi:hypothetical protein
MRSGGAAGLSTERAGAEQGASRKVHEALFSTLSQRAMRLPCGVARQTTSPCEATTSLARQVQSADAADDSAAKAMIAAGKARLSITPGYHVPRCTATRH